MAWELCAALLNPPSQLQSELLPVKQSMFKLTLLMYYSISLPPSLPPSLQFEGNLTVDIPPFILGYSRGRKEETMPAFDVEEEESLSHTPKTSLHVFVSVDPPLPQLPPVKQKARMNIEQCT